MTREQLLQKKPLIIAGPCAVESYDQLITIAAALQELGVTVLRAQLWKPRSSPQSFQGLGIEALDIIKEVKQKTSMIIASEIVDGDQIELTRGIADILWVGARNMQNYELLKKLGKDDRPVILKRGLIATVDEWVSAAHYIGLDRVILCERGIRTGADSMRFTLDINSALVAKYDKNMPVIIDPSHTAGRRDLVPYIAYAAMASGIDGVVIEVHNDPENAWSDADQQITIETFRQMLPKLHQIYNLIHHDSL